MKGLVIKNTGSWYLVKTEDGRTIECKIKGNFRLKGIRSTNPIAVGDYVQIIINNEGTAFISEIEDRKNYIIRRASNLSKQSHILAANLDQCMLIVTINYPETSTIFIDRFLATAEAYRVPVKLIFNKTDRYNEDDTRYMDALINLYTYIGYPCFKVSALNNIGTDEVKKDLEGKVTLLSGNSGVGKSTLINAILPEQTLKTGEISDYHNKGMHTTTFSEMFPARRSFLSVVGAVGAAAALTACGGSASSTAASTASSAAGSAAASTAALGADTQAIVDRGVLKVGVKNAVKGFSFQDTLTGEVIR